MRIVISQRAIVNGGEDRVTPCSEAPTLQLCDGFDTGMECIPLLSPSVRDGGLGGGRLRFRYDPDRNELRFYTEFVTTRYLSNQELATMMEETSAIWNHLAGTEGISVDAGSETVFVLPGGAPDRDLRGDQLIA